MFDCVQFPNVVTWNGLVSANQQQYWDEDQEPWRHRRLVLLKVPRVSRKPVGPADRNKRSLTLQEAAQVQWNFWQFRRKPGHGGGVQGSLKVTVFSVILFMLGQF